MAANWPTTETLSLGVQDTSEFGLKHLWISEWGLVFLWAWPLRGFAALSITTSSSPPKEKISDSWGQSLGLTDQGTGSLAKRSQVLAHKEFSVLQDEKVLMLDTINTLNYGAAHFKLVRMVDAMVWGSFTPIHPTPLKRGGIWWAFKSGFFINLIPSFFNPCHVQQPVNVTSPLLTSPAGPPVQKGRGLVLWLVLGLELGITLVSWPLC